MLYCNGKHFFLGLTDFDTGKGQSESNMKKAKFFKMMGMDAKKDGV